MKAGDLVRFKVSALHPDHTRWLRCCAKNRIPMLIVQEFDSNVIPVEAHLLEERVFEIVCEGIFLHAFEYELTKRGL